MEYGSFKEDLTRVVALTVDGQFSPILAVDDSVLELLMFEG